MEERIKTLVRKSEFASKFINLNTRELLLDRFVPSSNTDLEYLLDKLVSYKTITHDKATNRKAVTYIDRFLRKRGMRTRYVEHNGHPSLYAHSRDATNLNPTVLLAGHIDVVPAHDRAFRMQTDETTYRGRGVLDMKFAIASYLKLADELSKTMESYDFGILITSDEEIGGEHGLSKFVDEGLAPKVCILPDGGFDWQLQTFSKGMLLTKVTATGKGAHGSLPWLGDNAITKLNRALLELGQDFTNQPEDTCTLTIGRIDGGKAANQVPESAKAELDIRYDSSTDKARLMALFDSISQKCDVTFEVMHEGIPAGFDLKNPMIAAFVKLIEAETGVTVKGMSTRGTNDARFFAAINVPCVSLYIPGRNHHSEDEWIEKTGLEQFHRILRQYVTQITNSAK